MTIAVLGAGFTGLTAALKLSEKGHRVIVFEKEETAGGLASGFKLPGWDWALEKHYHHFFANDAIAFRLLKELKLDNHLIVKRPLTAVLGKNNAVIPFDSPSRLLFFPSLSPFSKIRTALTLLFLKLLPSFLAIRLLNRTTAFSFLEKTLGKSSFETFFRPLFTGKFGKSASKISGAWFWARIKKRTPKLVYYEGGYQALAEAMASKIKSLGGEIKLNTEVLEITSVHPLWQSPGDASGGPPAHAQSRRGGRACDGGDERQDPASGKLLFDAVVCTFPTPIFLKITPQLPTDYVEKLSKTKHLDALTLILLLKKPFFPAESAGRPKTYWLNINQPDFPFLALVEHTNFIDPEYYGNSRILYIGNYLPADHDFFKLTAADLFTKFKPYLLKINPRFNFELLTFNFKLFSAPFAQPIVTANYAPPSVTTPFPNLYLANQDLVFPYDRGVNYAVELGEKAAELVQRSKP